MALADHKRTELQMAQPLAGVLATLCLARTARRRSARHPNRERQGARWSALCAWFWLLRRSLM